MGRLTGKVAFITGAARGQGRAIAERFAAEGAAGLVLCDVEDPAGTIDVGDVPVVAQVADVRDQSQLDAVVAAGIERLGQIDVIVANAGITGPLMRFWEVSDEDWQRTFDVNMAGVWRTVKAAAPHLIERGSGSVIVTSSMNGIEGGVNVGPYVCTKHGVLGFMKTAGLELAPYGVRVNCVMPGPIDTQMLDNPNTRAHITGVEGASRDEYLEAMRPFFLLPGRTSLPVKAIADAMVFLASDESEHITGLPLYVDGGHSIMPGVNTEPVA